MFVYIIYFSLCLTSLGQLSLNCKKKEAVRNFSKSFSFFQIISEVTLKPPYIFNAFPAITFNTKFVGVSLQVKVKICVFTISEQNVDIRASLTFVGKRTVTHTFQILNFVFVCDRSSSN